MGNIKENLVPSQYLLSTSISHPIHSTIFLHIKSHKPVHFSVLLR